MLVLEVGSVYKVLVVGVYRPPSNTQECNRKLYDCLLRINQELVAKRVEGIIYAGDFNAHVNELDTQTDQAGLELKQFVENNQLYIMNCSERTKGKYTYTEGSKKSCVDYVIMSGSMQKWAASMYVDEEKEFDIGSDHNLVNVRGTNKRRKKEKFWKIQMNWSNWEVGMNNLRLTLKDKGGNEFTEVEKDIRMIYNSAIQRIWTHRKGGQRGWWSKEIREAILKRKNWSKIHRSAERRGDKSESEKAWEAYKKAKSHAQELIQKSINERDQKEFRKIMECPRGQRNKALWSYINKEKKKSLNKEVEKKYNKTEMNDAVNSLFFIGMRQGYRQRIRKREDTGINVELNEVMTIIKSMKQETAAGLDDITMKAIKFLEEDFGNYLVYIFNEIFKGARIPDSWHEGRVALIN